MAKTESQLKMIEGLGILLMIMGISLISQWQDITFQNLAGIIIATGGWLIYSFQNKLE